MGSRFCGNDRPCGPERTLVVGAVWCVDNGTPMQGCPVEVEVLPVVSTDKDHHLVGMIEQRRIQQVLSKEIICRRLEET